MQLLELRTSNRIYVATEPNNPISLLEFDSAINMGKHDHAAGQLKILVVKGTGLPAADIGGTSDPFVQIQVGHDYGWNPKVWKTSKIKKTLNPIWNEEFIVPVASPEKDGVRFAVFDYDFIGSNDLLGQVVFPNLHKLPLGVPTEAILALAGMHSSKGTLHVILTAMNFGVQGPTVIQTTTSSPAPVIQQTVVQQQPVAIQQTTTTTTGYNPYGAPAAVPAQNPYGMAPQQGYGAPPQGYGAPPPQNPYGAPPTGYAVPNMYGAPSYPPQNSYAQPPPQYGAPPPGNPYGAPPAQNPYGAPPAQNPYGAPPAQNPYGAPPPAY